MSVLRTVANTERTQFYVNNVDCTNSATTPSDFYNAAGAPILIAPGSSGDAVTAGLVLVRDMGRTVRVAASNGGIRLLRKVQRVNNSGLATNEGVVGAAGANPQYGIFYIELLNTLETGAYRSVKWSRVSAPN
jgi:hypothetical protein